MNTLLFVPSTEKMIQKISGFHADGYVIDLEDSIPDDKKEEALGILADYLSRDCIPAERLFVRLNGNRIEQELSVLNPLPFAGYMIPKFEDPNQYDAEKLLASEKLIIALVETPKGILNVEVIAKTAWVSAIAFGAEDFTASVGMKNNRDLLLPVRSRMLVAAKAYQKPIYDTPSFILDDETALEDEAVYAADLGFDGKLAIHPNQISVIQKAFRQYDSDYLKSVIERYEESREAVVKIDGKVYEKMHIAHMKRIMKERG